MFAITDLQRVATSLINVGEYLLEVLKEAS